MLRLFDLRNDNSSRHNLEERFLRRGKILLGVTECAWIKINICNVNIYNEFVNFRGSERTWENDVIYILSKITAETDLSCNYIFPVKAVVEIVMIFA